MDERGRPALDEAPRPIASGADPRRLYLVIGVLVGIIVLLVIRPWGDGPGPVTSRVSESRSPAGPGDTAGPTDGTPGDAIASTGPGSTDPYADLWVTCGSPSGWRAATVQAWYGRSTPIRSWIAIEPAEATGPLDDAIPFAPVATDVVTALGYCSPLDEERRPPVSTVAVLWAVGDAAQRLTPDPLEPATPNALGGLWRPGLEQGADATAWPPGRYVIELTSPSGTFHRWLGIQIEDLARRRNPSPGPSGSPDPSAAPPDAPPGSSPRPADPVSPSP